MPEIFVPAMSKDLQWSSLMRDAKVKDWVAWQLEYFKLRWKLPDKRLFFAKKFPLGSPGTWTKEQINASSGVPPMPEGVNQVLLKEMTSLIGISKKYGYDSTIHYHRKGMAVLPEYQRKGIASKLSQRLNEIVDEEGGTTYAVAVPAAMMLFKKQDFEIIGTGSMDMTKFGGTSEQGNSYVMLRKPQNK
ncbi:hypothetical protein BKA64DRAFT_637386 [Cadophora sp. MPI-SDFR-AT-0126]|nr:hypothetical protein BKA64DRAFT_637386 [Leotiomycetes sp. MPI-SDFR-AT-0126]